MNKAKGAKLPPEGFVVRGEVFASPSRVQVQGSKRKAGAETIVQAYPDICFTVDGSHVGFDQLVRVHSFSVLLELANPF